MAKGPGTDGKPGVNRPLRADAESGTGPFRGLAVCSGRRCGGAGRAQGKGPGPEKRETDGETDLDGGASGGNSGGGGGASSGGHAYSGTTLETDDKENDTIDEVSVFSDIDNVPWAKEAINTLYSLGVINGKEIGKFYPNDMITREEFVKMLVSAFSMKLIDEDVKFDDVSENDWSYDFIKTAYIAGIAKGVGGNMFGKTDNILRQDICVMINRLFDISKIDISAKQNGKIFVDADDISDYAKDAVNNMSAADIISGDESGNVNPMAYATRAEVAKLLFRAREVYNSKR